MSETGYIAINGKDLIYNFTLKTSGSNPTTSYNVGGVDLSNIFQPYDGTSQKAEATGFKVGGNDLCDIFQNSVNNINSNYNPFSASLTPTGYIYNIFNVSYSYTITSDLSNVYFLLVGGGGGGGSGFGYNGGGAGGTVNTHFVTNLEADTYQINIGKGGKGGPTNPSSATAGNGVQGGTTSISRLSIDGPIQILSASGGGGGGGSTKGQYGAGGTNGSAYGTGGTADIKVLNIQSDGSGNGFDGYNYTFQDGTNTNYLFGGGGGAGGRNSSGDPIPGPYLGGGGFVGTKNGINYTQFTGGCGGLGSYGISFFPGFDFSFNGVQYNVGSGGGAGGNSDANYAISGGTGNDGLAILYYPINPFLISPGTPYIQTSDETYNTILTFTGSGSILFYINTQINYIVVGGGAGGNDGSNSSNPLQGGGGGRGGGGGSVIVSNFNSLANTTYSLTIGDGGYPNNNGSSSFISSISTIVTASGGVIGGGGIGGTGGAGVNGAAGLTGPIGSNGYGSGGGGGGGGGGFNSSNPNPSSGGSSGASSGGAGGNGGTGTGLDGGNGQTALPNTGGGGGGGGGGGSASTGGTYGGNGGGGGSGIIILKFNV